MEDAQTYDACFGIYRCRLNPTLHIVTVISIVNDSPIAVMTRNEDRKTWDITDHGRLPDAIRDKIIPWANDRCR